MLYAGSDRWVWLALSGAIGYALGDVFLFQSCVCISAQRGMLMMSLAPLMSAGLAWIFFGEILSGIQMLGVIVTLAGIAWVILRKNNGEPAKIVARYRASCLGWGPQPDRRSASCSPSRA